MARPIVPDRRMPCAKQIVPVWETHGRTRRIVGFHALLNNDFLLVPGSHTTPRLFDTSVDAAHGLDEAALDLIAEAATTADLDALPFEPTAYEIADMRALAAYDGAGDDPWNGTEVATTYASTSDGETFWVTTLAPGAGSCEEAGAG